MTLDERMEAALNKLPSDAAGVAGYLVDRGITGVRDHCAACPFSRWLRTELQLSAALSDISEVIAVGDDGVIVRMDTPPGIAGFIVDFDLGGYPDMVDHNGMTGPEESSVAYL